MVAADEHVARADRFPEVDDGAIPFVVVVVGADLAGAPAPHDVAPS